MSVLGLWELVSGRSGGVFARLLRTFSAAMFENVVTLWRSQSTVDRKEVERNLSRGQGNGGSPTIPDVARRAGVSTATAARALGGYGAVSESAREAVLAAAEELGYRRNELARAMITGRTNTIGLVIADIENPFFARAVRGASDAARAAGYEVVLTNTDEDSDVERSSVRVLLSKRVDGIIAAPTSSDADHLAAAQQAGCPVVLFDRRIQGFSVDTVLVDNVAAARDAVDRLVEAGHRRIAMVTGGTTSDERDRNPLSVSTGNDRVDGFLDGLTTAGITAPQAYLRTGAHSPELACTLMGELLDLPDRPTAVFASDSRVALGVLKAIREAGLTVPEEISMIGFDDADWTSVVNPPISVVEQPTYALGRRAAELLLARLSGDEAPAEVHMLPTSFLSRRSVAGPPG
jgi:LacI family transcriptional regulator